MLIITENHNLGLLTVDQRDVEAPIAGRRLVEVPTYTCTHCEAVVVMNPERVRPRYTCRGCDHMICDTCAAIKEKTGVCKTFAQLVDEHLNRVVKNQPLILP